MKKIGIDFLGGESRYGTDSVNYLYDYKTGGRCIYAECTLPDTPEEDPEDPEYAEDFEDLEDWERDMMIRMYNNQMSGDDEVYGYLTMKRAILEELPEDVAKRIEWTYGDDDSWLDDCPQASVSCKVRVGINLDNLPADDDEERT